MKKFRVIHADPPWGYEEKRTGGSMSSAAGQKYEELDLDSVCNLDIASITDDNCVLFLWTTIPLIEYGFRVLEAWGFAYKTKYTWIKTQFGMGHWLRICTEDLLIGFKGNVRPFRLQERNHGTFKSLGHSKKPDEVRALIDRAIVNIPEANVRKVELFATKEYKDWVVMGKEIDGKDIREAIEDVRREIIIYEAVEELATYLG